MTAAQVRAELRRRGFLAEVTGLGNVLAVKDERGLVVAPKDGWWTATVLFGEPVRFPACSDVVEPAFAAWLDELGYTAGNPVAVAA